MAICTRHLLFLLLAALWGHVEARQVISLWGEDQPPLYKAHENSEYEAPCWQVVCAYQVSEPTLTLYLPPGESNGKAVVVLPGGGYEAEAVYHEGYDIAESLAKRGTVAAVLKYRLPDPATSTQPDKAPLLDVRQALALLRQNQAEYGFSATRFGVMGFSAGSHLATLASVDHATDAGQNPDFSMLIYGVTRMTEENREWLEQTFYHRPMTAAEIADQTLLERVDRTTPPALLVHSLDDETCHYSESTLYAEALTRHGVDAEIHLFARGGHGFGLGRENDGTGQWLELAVDWLKRLD